jgi:hypothetical protein
MSTVRMFPSRFPCLQPLWLRLLLKQLAAVSSHHCCRCCDRFGVTATAVAPQQSLRHQLPWQCTAGTTTRHFL